jgi:hypothetical protein
MNIINKNTSIYVLLAILSIVGEYLFQDFNKFSDGLNYYNAYEAMSNKNILDGFLSYKGYTGSTEPVSFAIFYSLSQFIKFHYANIALNFLLLCTLWKYFKYYSVSIYVWLPVVITNYYFLLVGFAVLRLKIALIFYFLFLLNKRYVFALFSVFSHFQMVLLYIFSAPILFNKNIIYSYKFLVSFIIILSLLFFSNINEKIFYYTSMLVGFEIPLKCLYVGFLSLFIIKDFKKVIVIFLLVNIAAIFLGEGRITLMYFILVLSHFISNHKNNTFSKCLMIISLSYLSLKGIDFGLSWSNQENYFS